MENEVAMENQESESRRKTQFQTESLVNFYSDGKFPSQEVMERYAMSLNLTYNQVRRWFAERRRKEKKETENVLSSTGETVLGGEEALTLDSTASRTAGNRKHMQRSVTLRGRKSKNSSKPTQDKIFELDWSKEGCVEREDRLTSHAQSRNCKQRKQFSHEQDMLSPDYILKKVFRKDGPPLGVEFDSPPAGTFGCAKHSNLSCHDMQRCSKRRKVSKLPTILDSHVGLRKNDPVRKHGMGKGLMTVWRATNPDAKGLPTGLNFAYEEVTNAFDATSKCHRSYKRPTKSQSQMLAVKQRMLGKKALEKRKPPVRKRRVESNNAGNQKKSSKAECKLTLQCLRLHELSNALTELMDDEELELRDLQAGPNPLTCSAHLQMNGMHGCSLCKDLLARFPPQSVKMKQPFCGRPREQEIVKKLFKVFRFLYTHSIAIDICPFTFDELVQAFHDKESLLLGKIHMAILKLLLSDVERELSSGLLPRACKDNRYLQFLQFVRCQEFNMQFWNTCLNSLTWTEIMRQVLIASGFGIKQNSLHRQILIKGKNRMARFGLRHGTLKGELFNILFEQGSKGLNISELSKSPQIVGLNLLNTVEEVEELICTTLSSDLTLFEKISPCAYRLRLNPIVSKGIEKYQSESEDSGSVNDDSSDSDGDSNGDDSEDSEVVISGLENRIIKHKSKRRQKNYQRTDATEIDESHSGEVWMLGLMEGEYSDLSLDEKLNALVALVDITSAVPSLLIEDSTNVNLESNPIIQHRGSGAKIKRSTVDKQVLPKPSWDHVGDMHNMKQVHAANARVESESCMHALQSIYLGSDRRYNSYWLFVGPCNENDPGHRRIYFESSEDGHWEIIDSQEALCALLSILDSRGTREAHLLAALERCEASLCQVMTSHTAIVKDAIQISRSDLHDTDLNDGNGSSPVSDVDNGVLLYECTKDPSFPSGTVVLELVKKGDEKRQKWDQLQAFDSWLWDSFYSNLSAVKYGKRSFVESLTHCESCHDLYWRDEKHCKTCHSTFELDFDLEERYAVHIATCREKQDSDDFPKHKVLPSKLQSLKAAAHAVEAAMPEGALVSAWTKSAHKLWIKRLRRTSSLPELLQVLTDFAGAINEEWLCHKQTVMGPNTAYEEIVVFFPTIPQTTSSVALWLVKLDAVIAPELEKIQSGKSKKALASNPRVTGRNLLRQ
ncbi:homeobox-DDT domain protein RLT3-like isoform X2 [Aristolochia californica]|uniref:homeobox-DDT domain protein RLT3-like isoform X2 n=1 Tax=Aristolochia californica TaxID=171875 RepID=UPI0035DBB702